MSDSELLKICINEIEKILNQGPCIDWTDRDFIFFSEKLQEQTGIYLSKNTLKNIIRKAGTDKDYSPQKATRDALVKFTGHENWHSYKQIYSLNKPINNIKIQLVKKINYRYFMASVFIFLIILFYLIHSSDNQLNSEYPIGLHVENPSGRAPHTVIFHYDISKFPSDSIFLDHGYEHYKMGYQMKMLPKDRQVVNHCYQIPDFYHVRIVSGDGIYARKKIHVLSNGWIGLASDRFSETQEEKLGLQFPEYKHLVFNPYQIFDHPHNNGRLYLHPEKIMQLGINPHYYWTEFRNIQDFNVSGDSCSIIIRFRNAAKEGGISCFDSQFIIQGDTSGVKLTLVDQGCFRFANAVIGTANYSGEIDDLSSFQFDLSKWRDLKINIQNDSVFFLMDNKLFWKNEKQIPMRDLKGLIFSFQGSGAIDMVRIENHKGDTVYFDDFEK